MIAPSRLLALLVLLFAAPAWAADPAAVALLRQALDAQGGEAALGSIRTLRVVTDGYRNMLEQSERPEGPYIVEFQRTTVEHDVAGNRWRRRVESSIPPFADYAMETVVDGDAAMRVAGGRQMPGTAALLAEARETIALAPERLLLTALTAEDARLGAPATLQSVPQDVIRFTLDGAPATLFLNRFTHLPTAVDYAGPAARASYWQYAGDTPMRTTFSSWKLGEGGIRLPMQWDVERGGTHEATYMVRTLSLNPALADDGLSIPEAVRAQYAAQAAASPARRLGEAADLAPGITFLPGAWNVAIVRQEDGLVILDAPISSAYSELVIAEAERLYPGLPVKAVVSTSDAWPHVAGVRAYAARGIPIYALDLNRPAIERLIGARFDSRPDALSATPRAGEIRPVTDAVELGTGANRMLIVPLRGETSERQLMVYFPGTRLLYGSDVFQGGDGGVPNNAQTASELADAVARAHLAPERYFMMHMDVAPWADLLAWLRTAPGTFPAAAP